MYTPDLMPCLALALGVASLTIRDVTEFASANGMSYSLEMSLTRDFSCRVLKFEIGTTVVVPPLVLHNLFEFHRAGYIIINIGIVCRILTKETSEL